MNRTAKRLGAIGTATVTVMGVGIAYAAWTATGSGSGAATADSAVDSLTVTSATTQGDLYPGNLASEGKLYVTVSSSKAYTTQFTFLELDTSEGAAIVSSDPTNCPASNVEFADQTFDAKTISSALDLTFSVPGVTLKSTAPDGCQGVSFTIPVTVG